MTVSATTRTIDLFGAGLGRTGTTSVQRALEQLGYHAYNFEEAVANDHLETWQRIFEGELEPDWPMLFAGYDATISWPASFYYRELNEAYPTAKFILTTRDPERWADSLLSAYRVLAGMSRLSFVPKVRTLTRVLNGPMRDKVFGPGQLSKEGLVASFNAHNDGVMRTIPAERLLVYEASQGWEPLCDFLDQRVPDVPFPYENKREDFKLMAYRLLGVGSG